MVQGLSDLIEDLSNERLYPSLDPWTSKKVDYFETAKDFKDAVEDLIQKNAYPKEYVAPLGCQLEITHRCNLKCIHCYNCSGEKTKRDIPFEKWVDVCHQLAKLGIFECVISGGEPLVLGDRLFYLMDILHNAGVKFIFITNGTLLEPRTVRKLTKYEYAWVQISLDGATPPIHEDIRGVKGCWEKAVRGALVVEEAGLPLEIAHILAKPNVDSIGEMVDLAFMLGAEKFGVDSVLWSGRALANQEKLRLDRARFEEALQTLQNKIKQYGNELSIKISPDPAFLLRLRVMEPSPVLLIRPDGNVRIDCIAPFVIGNIMDEKIADIWRKRGQRIWHNPKVLQFLSSIKCRDDFLKIHPKLYHDRDILINANCD